MTLPFRIDPTFWPFGLAILCGLVWAYTRTPNHWIKELWRYMSESKAESFGRLLSRHYSYNHNLAAKAGSVIFWLLFVAFAGMTTLSLLTHAGLVQNPPRSTLTVPADFDPKKVDLVMEDHNIYVRPKPRPTTGE